MRKRTIFIIVTLMTIALVGLIGFQLYWINNVIRLSSLRFEKDVQESLRNVAEKLERNEMLYVASRNNLWNYDTLNRPFWIKKQPQELEETEEIDDGLQDTSSTKFRSNRILKFKTNQNKVEFVYREHVESDSANGELRVIQGSGHASSTTDEKEDAVINMDRFQNKTTQLEVVVQDMLQLEEQNEHRIHPQVLDSLLHQEFTDKGINITFEYGVYNAHDNDFIIADTPNKDALRNSELKATLFPNDILGNVNYLMVNFPDQHSYLLKQVSATLATSLVLIGIIIFCFVYAINTILRQKKLSEIKNDFINNMTHEFKTPITTVSLASEALREEAIMSDQKTYNRYVQVIRDETNKLGDQVEKVLQAASFDKKEFALHRKNLDLVEVLHQVLEPFRIQVENYKGVLEFESDFQSLNVFIDPTHFSNAVQNLLDNALKYSPEKPRIRVLLTSQNHWLVLWVKDSGVGISKDQTKKIFDKFYRIPKGNIHNVKGFGLGLNYVKSVIEAHRGHVGVESEPGSGSRFFIKIPFNE